MSLDSDEEWKLLDLDLEKESVGSEECSRDSQDDAAESYLPTTKKRRVMDVAMIQPRRIEIDYRFIDEKDLLQEQQQFVGEVAQVLDIPDSHATVLLRHFAWSEEKLFEAFCLDPQRMRTEAGLQFADRPSMALDPYVLFDCLICYDSYPGDEVFTMGCGHIFCMECWHQYLSVKIAEGPMCVSKTTCPAHGCKEVVLSDTFKQFTGTEDYAKYARFVLRSYVDINKNIKWCPAPGCTKAISCAGGGLTSVACACGCKFCFRCGEEAHEPISCKQLEAWQEACRNESETVNWILANTKKCPECMVRIEKNEGCNHMRCGGCAFEFCWMCLQSWAKHDLSSDDVFFRCSLYDLEKAAPDTDNELDPYLHCYQRFTKHSQALTCARNLRKTTEMRMLESQKNRDELSRIDLRFLNTATEQLIECHRVLKYTHVFAYTLTPSMEKNLFEYLQNTLERNVERLTEMLKAPLEDMNRFDIMNCTHVTETLLRKLLTGIKDGLTTEFPLE